MPVDIGFGIQHLEFPLVLHDERLYQSLKGLAVGFNGLANLTSRGNTLEIEHRDIRKQLLLREQWETDGGVLRGKSIERGITDADVRMPADLGIAIGKSGAAATVGVA